MLRDRFSRIELVWAEGGYAERLVRWAKSMLSLGVEIVTRNDYVRGFAVLPRRWVVERTLAWLYKHRRCGRDYETRLDHHAAIVHVATSMPLSRRLARTA